MEQILAFEKHKSLEDLAPQGVWSVKLSIVIGIFAKRHSKMTSVSRFSRKNDAGLCALNVVLGENLAGVVVFISSISMQSCLRKEPC